MAMTTLRTASNALGFYAARRAASASAAAAWLLPAFDMAVNAFLLFRVASMIGFDRVVEELWSPSTYVGSFGASDEARHMRLETAWYLGASLSHLHALLLQDSSASSNDQTMLVHHAIALALTRLCLATGHPRMGVLMFLFMTPSNVLLHLAKALHKLGFALPAKAAFACFAAVFFALRLVAFPAVYVAAVATVGARVMPADLTAAYLPLMLSIVALQLKWTPPIVRVLLLRPGEAATTRAPRDP